MPEDANGTQPLEVYYSYAQEDEQFRKELETHLSLLRRKGLITNWYPENISAGTERDPEIRRHLTQAHIILLLISPDFLASDFCYSTEMDLALQRHEAREARVIPILVRPVSWEDAPFSTLQILPKDGTPILSEKWFSRDDAWLNVVNGLREVIADLQKTRRPSIPEPSQRIWHVPYRRNLLFTGRDNLLTQLHDRFANPSNRPAIALTQSQAISSLGGIGKTQTALEYAYRYRENYRAVLWVSAASEEALQKDFVTLAQVLGLPKQQSQDQQRIIAAVQAWLSTQQQWSLVLDNADDLAMTQQYLPDLATTNGHLLFTTRAQAVGHLAYGVEIEQIQQEDGALLLLRRAKVVSPEATLELASPQARTEAEAIVSQLGGLPLAIDQAGAYIEETGCGLAGYLALYRERRTELLRRRSSFPSDHPEPVATTWSLSFRLVEQANPAAADLLRLCAFLDPDAIPESLLKDGKDKLGSALKAVVANDYTLNQAIEELRKFSLMRRNADSKQLSLHRLVQAVLRDGMEEKVQRQWAKRVVFVVNAAFPQVEFRVWDRCRAYLPHALACATLIEQFHLRQPEAAELLDRAGWYLREQATYAQAEPLLLQARTLEEQLSERGQDLLAVTLNNLMLLYRDQGKYEQALPYGQQALAIYERTLGLDHLNTAITLDNLALLYNYQGKYEQAEPLFQRALTIKKQSLGADHHDIGITLNNLALLYNNQGKYEQAEPLYQEALANNEKSMGPEHPETATTLTNLADLYNYQGKYEQAKPLFQRALAIRDRSLGPDHPHTATTLYQLASLYRRQGQYEQAEPLIKRTITIDENAYGPDHVEVAYDLELYATLLQEMNRPEEAALYQQRAQMIRAKQQHS
jgi:tetratricopeptide (TPR) repeat protein